MLMPRLINHMGSQAVHWNHCQPSYLGTVLILPNKGEGLLATCGCLSWARKHLPLDPLSGRISCVTQPRQTLLTAGTVLFRSIASKSASRSFHLKSLPSPGQGKATFSQNTTRSLAARLSFTDSACTTFTGRSLQLSHLYRMDTKTRELACPAAGQ